MKNVKTQCNIEKECCHKIVKMKMDILKQNLKNKNQVLIISPSNILIGYCIGTCQNKKGIFETLINIIWNKIRKLYNKDLPKIKKCCLPQEKSALKIFRINKNGELILTNLADFTVKTCSCH